MGVLQGIVGHFDSGSEYDLNAYNEYLTNLISKVVNSQYNMEIMAKEITSTVMVEGKWYDDCAAEFAQWWNDIKGQKDGIDYLHGLSTVLELLVKITAADVCTDMMGSHNLGVSYEMYPLVSEFARGNCYIHGIRNLTKNDLGEVREIKCRVGTKMTANAQAINSMISKVSECADIITNNVKEICADIQEYLIDGRALKIKGLDSSVLEGRKKDMISRVETIVDHITTEFKKDKENIERDEATMKRTMESAE